MKSPAMSQPLSLLNRVEQKIRHSAGNADYRLITNDATGEKIVRLLSENPHGLLMARDELSGLFEIWTRNGREAERTLYLEAWNGTSPYSSDRVVSGTWTVPHLCLSVMGTIQPAKLARLLGGSGIEDGLAQRFQLLVFPEPMQRQFCDAPEDYAVKSALERILYELATADFRKLCVTPHTEDIPSLTFSREAYEQYKVWWIENSSRTDDPVLCSFTTKHERLVPALALIDHLTVSFSEGTPELLAPVPLQSVQRAIAQSEFFLSHVKRALGILKRPTLTTHDAILSRLESGHLVNGFSLRDLLRAGWTGLKNPDEVQNALKHLVADGVLQEMNSSNPSGGRKTVRYSVLSND